MPLRNFLYDQCFAWPELMGPAAGLTGMIFLLIFLPNRRFRLLMIGMICLGIPLFWHHHVYRAAVKSTVLSMSMPRPNGVTISIIELPLDCRLYCITAISGESIIVRSKTLNTIFSEARRNDLQKQYAQAIRKEEGIPPDEDYYLLRPDRQLP